MRNLKNQTLQSAKSLGFYSNFMFASDEVMSPDGMDVMGVRKQGEGKPYEYEVTKYDRDSGLAQITIMSRKEYLQIYG